MSERQVTFFEYTTICNALIRKLYEIFLDDPLSKISCNKSAAKVVDGTTFERYVFDPILRKLERSASKRQLIADAINDALASVSASYRVVRVLVRPRPSKGSSSANDRRRAAFSGTEEPPYDCFLEVHLSGSEKVVLAIPIDAKWARPNGYDENGVGAFTSPSRISSGSGLMLAVEGGNPRDNKRQNISKIREKLHDIGQSLFKESFEGFDVHDLYFMTFHRADDHDAFFDGCTYTSYLTCNPQEAFVHTPSKGFPHVQVRMSAPRDEIGWDTTTDERVFGLLASVSEMETAAAEANPLIAGDLLRCMPGYRVSSVTVEPCEPGEELEYRDCEVFVKQPRRSKTKALKTIKVGKKPAP